MYLTGFKRKGKLFSDQSFLAASLQQAILLRPRINFYALSPTWCAGSTHGYVGSHSLHCNLQFQKTGKTLQFKSLESYAFNTKAMRFWSRSQRVLTSHLDGIKLIECGFSTKATYCGHMCAAQTSFEEVAKKLKRTSSSPYHVAFLILFIHETSDGN